jgi:RHS repeat-associated protein
VVVMRQCCIAALRFACTEVGKFRTGRRVPQGRGFYTLGGLSALPKIMNHWADPFWRPGAEDIGAQTTVATDHKSLVYHQDHLGSIDVITEFGTTSAVSALDWDGKVSRYSYDAWGERRDPGDWDGEPDPNNQTQGGEHDLTRRGFTGHEMLDDLGLVHMNGRIYDPLLGRFLSADIVIQAPGNVQSYNRYSYVMNNPLSFVDPSGYFIEKNKVTSDITAFKKEVTNLASLASRRNLSGGDAVQFVSARINANRYVSTKDRGIIDMKHFLAAAAGKDKIYATEGMVRKYGKLVEVNQAKAGNVSAWGVEDLPSNEAGLEFESRLSGNDIKTTLADEIASFIDQDMGGVITAPNDSEIDKLNLIRNFSEDPILSSSDSDLVTDPSTGITNKSSGDPDFDRGALDQMAANGISGSSVGTTTNRIEAIQKSETVDTSDLDEDDLK